MKEIDANEITFEKMIEKYKEELCRACEDHTLTRHYSAGYNKAKEAFFASFGNQPALSLTPKDLGEKLLECYAKNPRFFEDARAFTRKAYRFLNQECGTAKNPMDFIPPLPSHSQRTVIRKEDIQILRENAGSTTYPNLAGLFMETALPIGELFGLKIDDIDFEKHELHIRRKINPYCRKGKAINEIW